MAYDLAVVGAGICGLAHALAAARRGLSASAADRLALIDRPADRIRLAMITSGTGASTSFAIGEEVIADLFG